MTFPHRTALQGWLVLACAGLSMASAGCAASHESRENLLSSLHAAMHEPVAEPEAARGNSDLVKDVVSSHVLDDMSRDQVADALGAGDPCSRHPRCQEQGFDGDDWYYAVGESRGPSVPVLIIGFDASGHVARTWYLETR